MEQAVGIEPTIFCLEGRRITTLLRLQSVADLGVEPSVSSL